MLPARETAVFNREATQVLLSVKQPQGNPAETSGILHYARGIPGLVERLSHDSDFREECNHLALAKRGRVRVGSTPTPDSLFRHN
jgi:hypothetical protein